MRLISTKLTPRERMLRWVAGEEVDRVPFVIYADQAPHDELRQRLGEGNYGLLYWVQVHRLETKRCRLNTREFVRDGRRIIERTLTTPEGSLVEERSDSPTGEANIYPIITQHMVRDLQDYRILQSYFRDVRVVADNAPMRQHLDYLGSDGGVQVVIDRTPYQALAMEWVGPEELSFHMADDPALVDETMDLMGQVLLSEAKVAAQSDAPYVCSADNITAPLIGRDRFARFVVPYYRKLAEVLSPKRYFVHMDGDLAALADLIAGSGVRGLDSMTPPPDNDMTVAEAVRQWPDMKLGVNFPCSVQLRSEEEIYALAIKLLDEGAASGNLQIQASENIPPGQWKVSYPAIARAIADHAASTVRRS